MSRNKTILFIAPTAYPLGGVAIWLNYILPGLQNKGWGIIFGMLSGRFHDAKNYIKQYPFSNTIEIVNSSGTRYGRVLAIEKAISNAEADIVVSVNVIDVFEAVNRIKRKKNKAIKAVMTLHALEVDFFEDIKVISDQLDAVVTTNLLTNRMVNKYCQFDNDRIYYAPYGVKQGAKVLSDERRYAINADKPIRVLYVGRIEEIQKRSSDLISLVQSLEKRSCAYELLIAGDGPSRGGILEELYAVCRIGSINYLGALSQQQLFERAYHKADALILTSQWETGPIVAWEAMANNVAVVTSRYIGCHIEKALIDKQNCLMFDVGDMSQASDCIIALRNQETRSKLVQAGFELVKKRYSRQVSITQWDIVMQGILNDKKPKPVVFLKKNWTNNSRMETLLGHPFAHYVRCILNKTAFISSPGDEWPHSYTAVNAQLNNNFIEMVHNVENE